MTIWHQRGTWHFFISAVYHTECMPYTSNIACIYDILVFWTPNFEAPVVSTFVVHSLWKSTKWLKTCSKTVVCNFVESLSEVLKLCPTKSYATFLNHPIYGRLHQSFLISFDMSVWRDIRHVTSHRWAATGLLGTTMLNMSLSTSMLNMSLRLLNQILSSCLMTRVIRKSSWYVRKAWW